MTKARLEKSKANVGEDQEPRSREFKSKVQSTRNGNLEIPTQELSNFELIVCLDTEVVKRDLESKRIVKEILIQGGVNSFVIE